MVVVLVAGAGAAGWWYQQDQFEQAQKKADMDAAEARREAEAAEKQAKLDTEKAVRKDYLHKEILAAVQPAEQGLKELHLALQTLLPDKDHPLTVPILLSDPKKWESRVQSARAYWQQAQKLAKSSPELLDPDQLARVKQLEVQVSKAEKDYAIAQELDDIRLDAATLAGGVLNSAQMGAKYEKVFQEQLHLEMRKGPLPLLAEQVRGSSLRYVLVAALDHWAQMTDEDKDQDLLSCLLEVARQGDPDLWRNQVRNENTWKDLSKLKQLTKDVQLQKQSPQIITLLVHQLYNWNSKQEAAGLLRAALLHHPADFWLNMNLGLFSEDIGERLGCFRGALAIRPGSANAHTNLGVALYQKHDLDGAIACYKKALEYDPKSASAHNNLGLALYDQNDVEGAFACYHKALECDPNYAKAHYNLGVALHQKHDLDGAIASYKKAVECDPKDAKAHTNLGLALFAKKDVEGAIACYQKALKFDAKLPNAYTGLGQALLKQGRFIEAKQATLKAMNLVPPGQQLHAVLQNQLVQCEQLLVADQKLAAILQGQVQPASAIEQVVLAMMCQKNKQYYANAAKFYAGAFAAAPNLANDLTKAHRYDAACCAALAAVGKGKDADKLAAPAKTKLRQQALDWLKADLALWQRQATSKDPKELQAVVKMLSHWQTDPDLASVRDDKALAPLPEAERQDWQALWADVSKLLQQAKK
jgi:tetratricopeptide (TPR) repeat protein